MANENSPPFATSDGSPKSPPSTAGSRGVNLIEDPSGGRGNGAITPPPSSATEQKSGGGPGYAADSVPQGGPLPYLDPTPGPAVQSADAPRKPFTVRGG